MFADIGADATDFERLLRFFQQLYAHALTLQEIVLVDDGRQYDNVKPKYDRQSKNQFEPLYKALNERQAFVEAVTDFLDRHPKAENFK